jgi:hypothetical protein
MIAFALGLFTFYHLWFFFLKPTLGRIRESKYHGVTGKGKIARLMFSQMVSSSSKSSILGVQQSRCAAATLP